jgi:hypothetical protein
MQSALVPPPDKGAASWTQRPALGEAGNLGQLYDVREDKVLRTSILKTNSQLLPDKSVQPTPYNSYTYEATVTDSLEEKFSKLQVPADFRASLLCGMLTGCWGVDYCSSQKTDARTVQASVICKTKKKSEDLLLANDELRECLDLDALHTAGATHVICGLEWGAQTIVTAEMTMTTVGQARSIRAGIGTGGAEAKDEAEEDVGMSKQGILGRVLDTIGKAHASGKVDWGSKFKRTASSFKFKIISDIGDPGIPRDVDDVLQFLETSKSEINKLNDGKGVPITFHLRPIGDIAKRFSITLQHSTTVQRLDEEYIDRFVKLLEKRRATRLELEEYEAFLEQHLFCVPASQIEKAGEQWDDAREVEDHLRMSLKQAVESIGGGRGKMDKLRAALKRGSSKTNIPSEYPSILKEYVDKIHFANTICFIVTINTRDWSIPYPIDQSHVLRLLLFNWLISMGLIIRFKGASSPLTACVPPARMCPALDQLPELLLFYSFYIIRFTFKYKYSFDQQELLIRSSLILVFSFSNAGTKKMRGTASRYPALDTTLNFYKWPYFCEFLLSSLTKCICNFRQSSIINRKSYSV